MTDPAIRTPNEREPKMALPSFFTLRNAYPDVKNGQATEGKKRLGAENEVEGDSRREAPLDELAVGRRSGARSARVPSWRTNMCPPAATRRWVRCSLTLLGRVALFTPLRSEFSGVVSDRLPGASVGNIVGSGCIMASFIGTER